MSNLMSRLLRVCVICAAAMPMLGHAALAETDQTLTGIDAIVPSPAERLNFVGAAPATLANGPERIYRTHAAHQARKAGYSQADLQCMAEALYHEARGEGTRGQAAVAEVILNRVDSRRFPATVCGVINQRSQFSYTIGGPKPIRNKAAFRRVTEVARAALSGAPRSLTGGATYFHTPAVRPSWSKRFHRTVRIGGHIFYRPTQRIASN